jgi:peroxiredoxin Q/BCP
VLGSGEPEEKMAVLGVGQTAPDFQKKTQDGESISLSQFRGDKAVVLYFYPKDETPGCTAEACAFRDNYEDFVDAGAVVIGVSQDSEKSHKAFAENHRLPFLLISDPDKALRKAYGVPNNLGFIPGRVTFVIDREGKIQHVFNSQINAKKHVSEALEVLRRLSAA